MPLSPDARARCERELADWLAEFEPTYPMVISDEEFRDRLRPMALNLVARYGIEALDMLREAATRLLSGRQQPRTAAQHWLDDQAAGVPEALRGPVGLDRKVAALKLMDAGTLDPDAGRALLADLERERRGR